MLDHSPWAYVYVAGLYRVRACRLAASYRRPTAYRGSRCAVRRVGAVGGSGGCYCCYAADGPMARCRSCIELQRESSALRPPTPTRGTRTSMSRRAGDGLGRPPPQRAQMLNQQSTHARSITRDVHTLRIQSVLPLFVSRLAAALPAPFLGAPPSMAIWSVTTRLSTSEIVHEASVMGSSSSCSRGRA